MKKGEKIKSFFKPPHPKGMKFLGRWVAIEPLDSTRHSSLLYKAYSGLKGSDNWIYLPYGPFASEHSYRAWIESVEGQDDPCFFAIRRLSGKKPLGVASYLRIKPDIGTIEVGHINFSTLLQKTTEATEAMYLMMEWAFESGYRRYEWKCDSLNLASRRAAQRLGLSYEGVFRQATINKGRNRDTAWFAAIDKEWPAIKTSFKSYLSEDNFNESHTPKTSLTELNEPNLFKRDNLEFS